jgi:hypothetical protein
VNSSRSYSNSFLDYDSEGNEITRDPKFDSSEDSDDDTRDTGDLTSNESLNESYTEDHLPPQLAPLHVDAPYWYKFGALMVQFPANLLGTSLDFYPKQRSHINSRCHHYTVWTSRLSLSSKRWLLHDHAKRFQRYLHLPKDGI